MSVKCIHSYLLLFAIFIFPTFVWSEVSLEKKRNQSTVEIKVSGLRDSGGMVYFLLFNAPLGFPEKPEGAMLRGDVIKSGNSASFVFKNIPYGRYAISVMHDENSNQKFDTNFLGMPKEGFGTALMKKGLKRKPLFEECAFDLKEEKRLFEIPISYLL